MIILLGLIDVLAGFLIFFNFLPSFTRIIIMILLLKGIYTLIITKNFFDILGLIDILGAVLYFSQNTGILINIIFIIIFLKGITSFIK